MRLLTTYQIPSKLKEEPKIFGKPITLYLKDIIIGGILAAIFWMASHLVSGYLMIPYCIFSVLCIVYLILPAGKMNPTKRKWQAIYYLILCDNNVYRSMDCISFQEELYE